MTGLISIRVLKDGTWDEDPFDSVFGERRGFSYTKIV